MKIRSIFRGLPDKDASLTMSPVFEYYNECSSKCGNQFTIANGTKDAIIHLQGLIGLLLNPFENKIDFLFVTPRI